MAKSLMIQTKTNDVDAQGRVTIAANGIGIEDDQGDISMPGSFDNTLKNDLMRMKWLYNHDFTQLLGLPLEGAEKDGNLVMVGQLNMEKQLCRDVYADYKLMAEYGRTLEHSIGVVAKKRNPENRKEVMEWKMYEFSTLAFMGSNPQTFLIDIKTATPLQVKNAVELLQKALTLPEYSDKRLNNLDMNLKLLLKKINGEGRLVTCPCCGNIVDYDEQEEITVSDQVTEYARRYTDWVVSDTVYDRIQELAPEIRTEVTAIVDALGSEGLRSKSIVDILAYVRCPHCWERIYSTALEKGDADDTVNKASGAEDEEQSDNGTDEADNSATTDEDEKKEKSFAGMLASLTSKFN